MEKTEAYLYSPELIEQILKSKTGISSLKRCDLRSIFESLSIIEYDDSSAKSTGILKTLSSEEEEETIKKIIKLASLKSQNVFVKIIPISQELPHDEAEIYKYLSTLEIERRSNNFIKYIASFECKTFVPSSYKIFLVNKSKIPEDELFENGAVFLILENVQYPSFHNFTRDTKKLSEIDSLSLLFKVLYGINEMNLSGIRHNDLHTGNIKVVPGDSKKIDLYFISDEEYFVLDRKYTPKIFDYDMAVFYASSNSKNITDFNIDKTAIRYACFEFGTCKNYNPYFDNVVFLMVCLLATLSGNTSKEYANVVQWFVLQTFQNTDYLEKWPYRYVGRLCHKVPNFFDGFGEFSYEKDIGNFKSNIRKLPHGFHCSSFFSPKKGELLLFDEMIERGLFDALPRYSIKSPENAHLPNAYAENLSDITNIFVSRKCNRSPISIHNRLWIHKELKKKTPVIDIPPAVLNSVGADYCDWIFLLTKIRFPKVYVASIVSDNPFVKQFFEKEERKPLIPRKIDVRLVRDILNLVRYSEKLKEGPVASQMKRDMVKKCNIALEKLPITPQTTHLYYNLFGFFGDLIKISNRKKFSDSVDIFTKIDSRF